MKNILFVIYNLTSGGAERSLVNLLNEIDYSKYNISLLMFEKKGIYLNQVPQQVKIKKSPYFLKGFYNKISFLKVWYYPAYLLKLIFSLFTKLIIKDPKEYRHVRWNKFYKKIIPSHKENYDLVCGYIGADVTYFVADKIPNAAKKLSWNHNEYSTERYCLESDKYYIQYFDKIITISNKCKEALIKNFPEHEKKIIMIPNLNSAELIKKRSDLYYPDEFNVDFMKLISIGRLEEQKNFDLAIDTAIELNKNNFEFRWVIIGIGSKFKYFKRRIKAYKLKDKVFLVGQKDNPYPYIKNADIFVQTSLYEGKSVALDEAKILATPIVSTNYLTVKDQISNDFGYIVDFDPKKIAECIMNIQNSKDYSEKKNYLKNNKFDNSEMIKDYYKLFEL